MSKELGAAKQKQARIALAKIHWECTPATHFHHEHCLRLIGFVQDYFRIEHNTIMHKMVQQ
ncbi:hypothetical protein E3J49_05720 [Candidatus Bathyarchaeota archaeon]|nr:MAG: hypothetical protein E3J49_05720 [Candidatus Bathyarchaeota archaeon]